MFRSRCHTPLVGTVLALWVFAALGCGNSDTAPDTSTISFNPTSWTLKFTTTPCSVYADERQFTVTVRNGQGQPINDRDVVMTSFNGAFALMNTDGSIITPDVVGKTEVRRKTDDNGNILLRVAVADCKTEDDIVARSGTAVALAHIKVTPETNAPPTAVASAVPTSGVAPLAVSFSSAGSTDSDGTIASFSWNFGDGSAASTAANPSHTYTAAGTFTATLTVTDDGGKTATATVTITVT